MTRTSVLTPGACFRIRVCKRRLLTISFEDIESCFSRTRGGGTPPFGKDLHQLFLTAVGELLSSIGEKKWLFAPKSMSLFRVLWFPSTYGFPSHHLRLLCPQCDLIGKDGCNEKSKVNRG